MFQICHTSFQKLNRKLVEHVGTKKIATPLKKVCGQTIKPDDEVDTQYIFGQHTMMYH